MDIIKTDVPCPSCKVPLCNLCGFNGYCQDCGERIPPATDAAIVDYVEAHAARGKV